MRLSRQACDSARQLAARLSIPGVLAVTLVPDEIPTVHIAVDGAPSAATDIRCRLIPDGVAFISPSDADIGHNVEDAARQVLHWFGVDH
jgi:hypothetical protein